MEFIATTTKDLSVIAGKILQKSNSKIFLLNGELGVGKTTLIKALVKELGSKDDVQSPTFSIINEYKGQKDKPIYHFDFYRVKTEEEVMDMGYEEYFYSGEYNFIEWPEKVPSLLPKNSHQINLCLDFNRKHRKIIFK